MNIISNSLTHPFETPPEPGAAIEVAPGVFWLRQPLPMTLDHVNVYALDDGDGWTIVDTGFDTRKSQQTWQMALQGPLIGKPVKRVVVTHHHPDHIGLAGWFQTERNAELVTTRTAWLTARMLTLDVHDQPKPETVAFWRSAGMPAEMIEQRLRERPFNLADVVAPLPLGFTRLVEGQIVNMGGRNWTVRMGNGHAPEHATFWSLDDALVIGGDQLLSTISPNIGVYATEPGADPLAEWLEACERLKVFARDDQLVLPGHKLPFTGLPVRMRQLIENHHGALERLMIYLRDAKTASECFSVLFKRNINQDLYGLALVESVAHVSHLYQSGKIDRHRRHDGAWVWQAKEN